MYLNHNFFCGEKQKGYHYQEKWNLVDSWLFPGKNSLSFEPKKKSEYILDSSSFPGKNSLSFEPKTTLVNGDKNICGNESNVKKENGWGMLAWAPNF